MTSMYLLGKLMATVTGDVWKPRLYSFSYATSEEILKEALKE
jgi:hypothetical protein